MRLFQEQNLPSKAVCAAKVAQDFVFKTRNFGYEHVYLEFNEAPILVSLSGEGVENQNFIYE